jgi:glyoxylase-like metal-dependent hydrolase (beta-lactamase superfamily II)
MQIIKECRFFTKYKGFSVEQPGGDNKVKRTFITHMPDKSGAFLKASTLLARIGVNVTRVSYNRAVDVHMLVLDVSGTPEQLNDVQRGLQNIGYTQTSYADANVMLLEFKLRDVPGAVTPILELIYSFNFNITYINSQENGTDWQYFKMGLLVEAPQDVKEFLDAAAALCEVRVIEYERTEKLLDNTVFYLGFADQLSRKLTLSQAEKTELITQSNLLMQLLDEKNEPPYKTFEYIAKIGDMLKSFSGDAFKPRVMLYELRTNERLRLMTEAQSAAAPSAPAQAIPMYVIEPPCGSNVYVLDLIDRSGLLLFIDSGFACYEKEMLRLLRGLFPRFDSVRKEALLTHPDLDHAGLLYLFDKIYLSEKARLNFKYEHEGNINFRELNPAHAPYYRISRIVSGYNPPPLELLQTFAPDEAVREAPGQSGELVSKTQAGIQQFTGIFTKLANLNVGGITFDVYLGNNGHAVGEAVFVDEEHKLVFCGDIIVNPGGFTPEQNAFNRLAPYLMTSVNMDSKKAAIERGALLERFSRDEYAYCCGHGAVKQ